MYIHMDSKTPPFHLLVPLVFSFAAAIPAEAAPYTGWASDYTGNEANTLALWKFDSPDPALDSSSGGHSIAFHAGSTQTGVEGKFGEAFQSLGPRSTTNSGYAIAADTGGVLNSSELSVDFWFRPSFVVSDLAAWNTLFDKSGATSGLWLRMNAEGALTLLIGNGTVQSSVSTGALSWDASTWYNIAVTFKNSSGEAGGAAEAQIFVNGFREGGRTLEGFGNLGSNNQNWKIGQRRTQSYSSVPGYYDNFRVSSVAYDYAPIPEPSSLGFLLIGGGALAWKGRQALRN